MFIKYCVFSKILKYIPDSGLSRFPLVFSVCTQWQVKHQRCSRTCRVQENHNISRKNTIFNEHPVCVCTPILSTTSLFLYLRVWRSAIFPSRWSAHEELKTISTSVTPVLQYPLFSCSTNNSTFLLYS